MMTLEDPEWYRLSMILSCPETDRSSEENDAAHLFQMNCKRLGRKNVSYAFLYNGMLSDGVLLSLLTKEKTRMTPALRRVVSKAERAMSIHKLNFRNWEIITTKTITVGTEYLVQLPAYAGVVKYFATVFYRPGWSQPLLFDFLSKPPTTPTPTTMTTTHRKSSMPSVMPFIRTQDDDLCVSRKRTNTSSPNTQKKQLKAQRKRQKTNRRDRYLKSHETTEKFLCQKIHDVVHDVVHDDVHDDVHDYDDYDYDDYDYDYDYPVFHGKTYHVHHNIFVYF